MIKEREDTEIGRGKAEKENKSKTQEETGEMIMRKRPKILEMTSP